MSYNYNVIAMQKLLAEKLFDVISPGEWDDIQSRRNQFQKERKTAFFNLTFALLPRLVKKDAIGSTLKIELASQNIRPRFHIRDWKIDRLARAWWLLQLPAENKTDYFTLINGLFRSAEINEQVALYGSLPLFAYPKEFCHRTAEGLRTNIRQIFESIALYNPYPADYLEESAWNQMILKSLFMNVEVNRIIGLDQRSNQTLAHILSDYAHERWSANRPVNPLLWRPVGKFLDEKIFSDIQRLFQSSNEKEIKAAALTCSKSHFEPAKKVLKEHAELEKQINEGLLDWDKI